MILKAFDLDLFSKVKEIKLELNDSKYILSVELVNKKWTFFCYYIQENMYNNLKAHKDFISDFTECITFM